MLLVLLVEVQRVRLLKHPTIVVEKVEVLNSVCTVLNRHRFAITMLPVTLKALSEPADVAECWILLYFIFPPNQNVKHLGSSKYFFMLTESLSTTLHHG
jgi:hypothetical protein